MMEEWNKDEVEEKRVGYLDDIWSCTILVVCHVHVTTRHKVLDGRFHDVSCNYQNEI